MAWRDVLSAVAMQEPRLRQRIRVDTFRTELVAAVVGLYVRQVAKGAGVEESSEAEANDTDPAEEPRQEEGRPRQEEARGCLELEVGWKARDSSDHVVPSSSCPASPALPSPLHSPCVPSSPEPLPPSQPALTAERYLGMRAAVVAAAGEVGGCIGDWELVQADTCTRLRVRPGYGASRKVSFLRPDFAAVLSYSLTLAPHHVSLTLNDSPIPATILASMLEREGREGTLSFLYQLISLRPCFGSFSPELVETVRQWDEPSAAAERLYIDAGFIGTSGSGRTYAGTVRTLDCGLIASDRVSDTCAACRRLDRLTINRSLLGAAAGGESKDAAAGGGKASQKSVWQLATTTEDACSFVCPQVQSFNTSLPHAFNSASQATAVVEHRAEIRNNLEVSVALAGRPVARRFPEFARDRQLGPLLDWVAGLRLCTGYPAHALVTQAAFLLEHRARLRPELTKLVALLQVDQEFRYTEGETELEGTIRSGKCLAAAEAGADICHQCRLLQEPMEFLNMA